MENNFKSFIGIYRTLPREAKHKRLSNIGYKLRFAGGEMDEGMG